MIAACIRSAKLLTADIVVIDNGSTDGTRDIAAAYGCRVYQNSWNGYGANKNIGVELAKHEWILSIDADEILDAELVHSLQRQTLDNPGLVYDIQFKSYFGKKLIRFGSWGRGHHIRLFNRNVVRWSEQKVHEELILPKEVRKKRLSGYLHHYCVQNVDECRRKSVYYARLSAEKYFQNGKEAGLMKLYVSPVFSFVISYILLLGFLDGREGWDIARFTFRNKWLKYHRLQQMNRTQGNQAQIQEVQRKIVVPDTVMTVKEPGLTVEYEYLKR